MSVQTKTEKENILIYPLLSARDRLALLERVRGMWKNRRPDPIKELEKIRREWNRKLPSLGRK